MSMINVNGVSLHYRELGSRDNPTVVFSHLLGPWSSEVFDALVAELNPAFHIVTIDQHGHGESGYRTRMTLEGMADDYYQLLTDLRLSKVIWVGHSVGGMIGMRIAMSRPELIGSLILIATTARLDPPELLQQTSQLWELFRDGHREDIVEPALPFLFSPATYKNQPDLVEQARNKLITTGDATGRFEVARAVFTREDISEQIRTIKAPTLVIAGRDDPSAPPAEAEVIASQIPNSELRVLDDAGHMVVIEKPQHVARAIKSFLGRICGQSAGSVAM
jgi:pimeloyl-ACP methyl ester carboxylesterase